MTTGGVDEGRRRRRPTRVLAPAALLIAVAVLTVLVVTGRGLIGGSELEPRAGGPNFVVIMADDQAMRDMDVMTSTRRLLAAEGVTFENSFVSFPLCCPSRVTFLTGQHPHNHGVVSNQGPDGGFEGFDDRNTLPVALQEAGYETGLFGKYLNGYGRHAREHPAFVPRGWSRWHAIADRGMFDYTLAENGELRRYGSSRRDYQTDVLAREAVAFLEDASTRRTPFFAFISTYAAHTERAAWGRPGTPNPRAAPRHASALRDRQFERPPNFNPAAVGDKPSFVRELDHLKPARVRKMRRHDRDRARSLLAVDDLVRDVVRQLRRSGVLAETYIMFTSDHGFQFGEHRRRGKQDLYEESARVPLIIRGPGLPHGRTASPVVSNVDLAPTILGAARVEPLRTSDGIDLRDVVAHPARHADRDVLLANASGAAVRSARFTYAEHDNDGMTECELYDVVDDPYQQRNLVDVRTGRLRASGAGLGDELAALRTRLERLRDCEGSTGKASCE